MSQTRRMKISVSLSLSHKFLRIRLVLRKKATTTTTTKTSHNSPGGRRRNTFQSRWVPILPLPDANPAIKAKGMWKGSLKGGSLLLSYRDTLASGCMGIPCPSTPLAYKRSGFHWGEIASTGVGKLSLRSGSQG